MGTSPSIWFVWAGGDCGGAQQSLGPHLPGHMAGHTHQQAAEQGSCSGFLLVSTHELANLVEGLVKCFVSP